MRRTILLAAGAYAGGGIAARGDVTIATWGR